MDHHPRLYCRFNSDRPLFNPIAIEPIRLQRAPCFCLTIEQQTIAKLTQHSDLKLAQNKIHRGRLRKALKGFSITLIQLRVRIISCCHAHQQFIEIQAAIEAAPCYLMTS